MARIGHRSVAAAWVGAVEADQIDDENEMLVFHANGRYLKTIHSGSPETASHLLTWSRTHNA